MTMKMFSCFFGAPGLKIARSTRLDVEPILMRNSTAMSDALYPYSSMRLLAHLWRTCSSGLSGRSTPVMQHRSFPAGISETTFAGGCVGDGVSCLGLPSLGIYALPLALVPPVRFGLSQLGLLQSGHTLGFSSLLRGSHS